MKNTVRTVTIAIDTNEIKREVYAESACIALMTQESERPEIITDDNRKLMRVYIGEALVEFASRFCAFIDSSLLNLDSEDEILQIPMLIPESTRLSLQMIRRLIEKIISSAVLAMCYETNSELSQTITERRNSSIARLLVALIGI